MNDKQQLEDGQLNLVEEVKKLLKSAGLVKECDEIFLTDPTIVFISDRDYITQKIYLNRFWRTQLSAFGSESMQQRYCLIDGGTGLEWLGLFKSSVMPFIISKSLPRLIK